MTLRNVLRVGLALVGVALVGDAVRRPRAASPPAAGRVEHRSAVAGAPPAPRERPEALLAREAIRSRLRNEGRETYLDSMLVTTDSVVRRWPDRPEPLRVAAVEGGTPSWVPAALDEVRAAVEAWHRVGAGPGLRLAGDTAGADIVVRWIERFELDRAGQTDLLWDRRGTVKRAYVTLAFRDHAGMPLAPDGRMAVALHEIGHALGLPHSARADDALYPSTVAVAPSTRDRQTIRLLYDLPIGRVSDER